VPDVYTIPKDQKTRIKNKKERWTAHEFVIVLLSPENAGL